MSFPARADDTAFPHSTALSGVIRQLRATARVMGEAGLEQEAGTLETTINDLEWQYEDLIEKELMGQWPNGSLRPARAAARRPESSRLRVSSQPPGGVTA